MKKSFSDLWYESTIIQGAIALSSVGTVLYLYIASKPVPDFLLTLIGTIIGFYFGSKTTQRATKEAK